MMRRISATGYPGVYYYGDRFLARISGVVGKRWRKLPDDETARRKELEMREAYLQRDKLCPNKSAYTKTTLGIFDTLSEAVEAYEEAKEQKLEQRREEREEARRYKRMLKGLPETPEPREKSCEYVGVIKQGRSYIASISINGRCKYLGRFKTPEEARDAYLTAKRDRDRDA